MERVAALGVFEMEQIEFIDLELIDPPKDAWRDVIDPEEVRGLAESIRSQGLIEPIILCRRGVRFEVAAGHRRWLAHRLIGEAKIKAIVKELSEEELLLVRAIENDQRVDLNPMERAKGYKRLQDQFGWSSREIGVRMGKHRNTIDKYLKVLGVPEEFQDAVARKKLGIEVALELLKIDDAQSLKMHFQAAVYNGVTFEVAQQWVLEYEKTRLNIAQGDEGGGGAGVEFPASLPIFQACVCCFAPTDITKLKTVFVCPECAAQIRGALAEKKS